MTTCSTSAHTDYQAVRFRSHTCLSKTPPPNTPFYDCSNYPGTGKQHLTLVAGGIEQAITSHPLVAEASVVGIPDAIKGQLPFAFVTLSSADTADRDAAEIPEAKIAAEIQALVRKQVGAIASLGGIILGKGGMIPRTRSGKTIRRVLRELVENGVHGDFDRPVTVPSTVEDASAVDVAREKVREYFGRAGTKHAALEARAKL